MSAILESLAFPLALTLLAALPLLAMGALLGWFARRRGLRLLGSLHTRTAWSAGLIGKRFFRGLLIAIGLLLVGIAAAGPRWGREKTDVLSAARVPDTWTDAIYGGLLLLAVIFSAGLANLTQARTA